MKTLILWQEIPPNELKPKFLEVEGDYSRWNGVYINEADADEQLTEELTKFIYDSNGREQVQFQNVPSRDWDIFVHCGFLN